MKNIMKEKIKGRGKRQVVVCLDQKKGPPGGDTSLTLPRKRRWPRKERKEHPGRGRAICFGLQSLRGVFSGLL